jgi:catechol 2,3-dioxygenase-like lactoylglutathione lyase family enzyme
LRNSDELAFQRSIDQSDGGQAMLIRKLHHAQITIPIGAEGAARAFYCGVMGLREISKPASLQSRGGFWLALDDIQVHVGVEDGVAREKTKAHLAYEVDDLPGWRAHLAAAGVEVLEAVPMPSCERMEFRDPFGNRVEMIEVIGSHPAPHAEV